MKMFALLTVTLGLASLATTASAQVDPGLPAQPRPSTTCPTGFNPTKTWSRDSSSTGDWSVGIGGSVGLRGDCTAIGVEAAVALRARVYGFEVKPMEVKLTATTDKDRKSSVDLSLLAFGYELQKYKLANSTSALSDTRTFGQMLPRGLARRSIMGSTTLSRVTLKYQIGYEAVGTVAGSLHYQISPEGINASLYGYVDSRLHVTASGSVSSSDLAFTVSGDGNVQLLKASADARGAFTPTFMQPPVATGAIASFTAPDDRVKNAWRLTSSMSYWLQGALNGSVAARAVVTKPIQFAKTFDVLELHAFDPTAAWTSDEWSYDRTFLKPF